MTQQDTIRAAQDLTVALKGLSERLEEVRGDSEERDEVLARYGRGNRRRIVLTGASLAIDVILTVFLAVFAVQAHHAAASSKNLCLSVNAARADQVQLWNYVVSLGQKARTAAEKEKVAAFEAHLHALFAPRNCNSIRPGQP